ncbi:MAG: aspartyl/glutamyl-tRNA amidotransferase subunit A [Chloroflexi bacterium]|nr:aspartyl/glutamyl-tRNA amidotransferase subunit A [Chloroflexota bacterium]
MADGALSSLAIAEASRMVRRGQVSCLELTQAALERIDEANPTLNAFITVLRDEALDAAREADRRLATDGPLGPLHGIPVSLKDLYDTRGIRTTAASRLMAQRVPQQDATVVTRLKQAGAIIVGKANMPEFAYGGIHPEYGSSKNPWDPARSPGGSSSGSAISVATGMSYASMGSDTGGSIRIPAAFCGVVGLKPTYGRVSRHGVVPLSWTLDHAGPLTRTVRDAALMLRVIAGQDARDPASSARPVPNYARGLPRELKNVTIGVPQDYFYDELDGEVERALDAAHVSLRRLGARLKRVSIPHASDSLAAASVITPCEAGAFHWQALRDRPGDFSDSIWGRFTLGLLTPADTYLRAQRLRSLLMNEFHDAFKQVDAMVLPTVPILPDLLGERPMTREGISAIGRCTRAFNLTGLPALSLPCGFTGDGLPIGMQLIGRPFDEATLFKIGHAYEQATDWHTRRPAV